MTASADNSSRFGVHLSRDDVARLKVIRYQRGDEFRSCALRLFSRLEWRSLSTDWKYRGVLDDITEPRTFVRIVAACPPPPRRGIFRLVSLASGWRRWSVGRSAPFRHQHLFKRAERIPTEVDEAEAALSR
jgi:hypothetical protein